MADRLDAPVDPDALPFPCDPIYKVVAPDGAKLAFVGRMYSAVDRYGLFVIELKTGVVRQLIAKDADLAAFLKVFHRLFVDTKGLMGKINVINTNR